MIWANGAGSYGAGWGKAGRGVTVRQGGTLYVKYYSGVDDARLSFAEHGAKAVKWRAIGPVLAGGIGNHPGEPVVVKFSNVGTRDSTVVWTNGRGTSGRWSGLPAPGAYDLALHAGAQWTLPPIYVTQDSKPSFWSTFVALFRSDRPAATGPTYAVPETGGTAWLLGAALLALAIVKRMRS
jgi:hypothetical protein